MKHISTTFMYIIPMYLRLTTFTKTFPQMSFHLYFFAIFISLWGSTHDSADCWTGALTDPRLPATASNVCTTDARLGGVGRVPPPPKQKSWLRRWRNRRPKQSIKCRKRFISDDVSNWFCILCSEAHIEPMTQCISCKQWVHDRCADQSHLLHYVCDLCA